MTCTTDVCQHIALCELQERAVRGSIGDLLMAYLETENWSEEEGDRDDDVCTFVASQTSSTRSLVCLVPMDGAAPDKGGMNGLQEFESQAYDDDVMIEEDDQLGRGRIAPQSTHEGSRSSRNSAEEKVQVRSALQRGAKRMQRAVRALHDIYFSVNNTNVLMLENRGRGAELEWNIPAVPRRLEHGDGNGRSRYGAGAARDARSPVQARASVCERGKDVWEDHYHGAREAGSPAHHTAQ